MSYVKRELGFMRTSATFLSLYVFLFSNSSVVFFGALHSTIDGRSPDVKFPYLHSIHPIHFFVRKDFLFLVEISFPQLRLYTYIPEQTIFAYPPLVLDCINRDSHVVFFFANFPLFSSALFWTYNSRFVFLQDFFEAAYDYCSLF